MWLYPLYLSAHGGLKRGLLFVFFCVWGFKKGGTVKDGKWTEPAYFPQIFKAVEITTLTGLKFACPKAQLIAKFTAKFTKEGGKLIDVSIIPMEAEQGKGSIVITPPAA